MSPELHDSLSTVAVSANDHDFDTVGGENSPEIPPPESAVSKSTSIAVRAHNALLAHGPMGVNEIAHMLGITARQAGSALGRLRKARPARAKSRRIGGSTMYVGIPSAKKTQREVIVAAVIDLLSDGKPRQSPEVARTVGATNEQYVRRILQALHADGRVEKHQVSSRVVVYAKAGANVDIAKYRRQAFLGFVQPALKASAHDLNSSLPDGPPPGDVGTTSLAEFGPCPSEGGTFYCKPKKRTMPFATCLDLFTDAHAKPLRGSACWKCRRGARNRLEYATGKRATTQQVSDMAVVVAASTSGRRETSEEIAARHRLRPVLGGDS